MDHLQVHHLSYATDLYAVPIDQLRPLCPQCHHLVELWKAWKGVFMLLFSSFVRVPRKAEALTTVSLHDTLKA
jgi:hypothetical protein